MPEWLWCRDPETGHCFDLDPSDIRIAEGTVEVVKGYAENKGLTAQPRPAKHNVDKAGMPSTPESPSAEPQMEPEGVPAPTDNPPAVTSANPKRSNANG